MMNSNNILKDLQAPYSTELRNVQGMARIVTADPTNVATNIFGQVAMRDGVTGDTGFKSPSTTGFAFAGLTTNAWTNPTNAYANDGTPTTHVTVAGTEFQSYGGFGFNIPTGSTITGIEITVNAKTSATFNVIVVYVGDIDSGQGRSSMGGFATLTTSYASYTFGGPTSLASRTWTDADMSDADFVVLIQDINQNPPALTTSVDYVQAKIYYTSGGLFLYDYKNSAWRKAPIT